MSNTTVDRRAMVRPTVIVIVAAAVVLGGIFGFHLFVGKMIQQGMSKG